METLTVEASRTYEVKIVDLEDAIGYEDIKDLVKIGLGDTVYAENKNLNITTKNRCMGLTYDCILQRNKEVTLGETQTDYFDKMTSVQQKVNQSLTDTGVKGEMVYGLIDLFKASMKATAESAELQKEKAIFFEDKVPDSPTYGAMALGTTGFMIADKRLTDDSDWDWRTFGTGKGFLADFIIGGVLMSLNYVDGETGFKLDLNNGIIETARLLIKTAKDGSMEKGIQFGDGRLQILGPNGDVKAEIYYDIDLPDGEGIPSGFQDFIIATKDRGSNGEYARIRMRGSSGTVSVECSELDLNTTQLKVNAKEGITGRIEYSDGTYIDLEGGVIVGGNAKEGAF